MKQRRKKKATKQSERLAEYTNLNAINKQEMQALIDYFETNLFNPIPR